MSTLAFIPARSGSTRVVRKNLQRVGGLTLLDRAIVCALDADCDRVVVSTNCPEIAHDARCYSRVEVHDRPEPLASATAQIEDAIAHWLHRCSPTLADDDVVCICQPTSPFRRPETVRACVELVRKHGHDVAVAGVRDAARVLFTGRIRGVYDEAAGRDVAFEARWDHPPAFRPRTQDVPNDAVDRGLLYAFTAGHFRRVGYRMAERTGYTIVTALEAFDVDTPLDLEIARLIAPHAERLLATYAATEAA